jgi:hypothetical protein
MRSAVGMKCLPDSLFGAVKGLLPGILLGCGSGPVACAQPAIGADTTLIQCLIRPGQPVY